jgi:hypothetical protein
MKTKMRFCIQEVTGWGTPAGNSLSIYEGQKFGIPTWGIPILGISRMFTEVKFFLTRKNCYDVHALSNLLKPNIANIMKIFVTSFYSSI